MFWDFGIGGVQTRLQDIIIDILKRNPQNTVTLLLKRRVTDVRQIPRFPGFKVYYYSDDVHQGQQGKYLLWLLRQLIRLNPTHILAILNRFTVAAIVAKILIGLRYGKYVRVVVNQVVFTSAYIRQYEKWYWHFLVGFFYRWADAIILPTHAMKYDLIRFYKLNVNSIHIVPSWVKKNLNRKVHVYDGIFVGRLAPEKRIDQIVALGEAISASKIKFRVAIVGNGELKDWLLNQIKVKKLEKILVYLGFKAHPIEEIRKADILLLPSMNEGLPMTVLEAAAVGVPASVHNYPGAAEVVVSGKTGWIFSEKEYVAATLELLKQKKILRDTGANAKVAVRNNHSFKRLREFSDIVLGS